MLTSTDYLSAATPTKMCQHLTPSSVAAQRPFSKRKVSSEPKILGATALKLQFSHLQFSCWCLFSENLHLKIPTNHLHSVYLHKSSFNCLVSHASCQISIPGQSSDMSLLCPSFLLAFEILTQYGSFLPSVFIVYFGFLCMSYTFSHLGLGLLYTKLFFTLL